MSRSVLAVVAHADDEVLGCGGALRRHVLAGDVVHVLRLTDGVGARGDDAAAAARRVVAERAAAEAIGFTWLPGGTFPDNRLDAVALLDVVQFVEAAFRAVSPELVYLHHPGDLNIDHAIAARAVLTAARPQPGAPVRELRAFEVPSSTEWAPVALSTPFLPDLYVDTSAVADAVQAALQAYGEELRPAPHARSLVGIDARAVLRGAEVGLPRAEAFAVLRRVVRAGDAP